MIEPRTGGSESEALKVFREIYQEGNRAWNEGDFRRAYGALPEDFEYHLAATWPQARSLRGPDEIVAFFQDFRETFPDVQSGPSLEFIQVDERTIVVGFEVVGTGAISGVGTTMEIWQVWEMREVTEPVPAGTATALGMVPVRVREFSDRGAALEAAGAAEPAERET